MNVRVDPGMRRDPPAIEVADLSVERGGREVLRNLSLGFERGAVTAVIGPSGAGKTTLVHSLNGLVRPARGRVASDDHGALTDRESWARQRERTATIFQDHALIGRLSAFDNVLLGLADRRSSWSPWPWPAERRRQAARALADVGLLARAFDRVDALSGGEKQRIGIARALVRRPRVLFGDEPFASLDLPLARRIAGDLRRLATRDGVTVVLVLHQTGLARAIADRIVGLNRGTLRFDGPVRLFDEAAEANVFAAVDSPSRTAKSLSP